MMNYAKGLTPSKRTYCLAVDMTEYRVNKKGN